MRGKGTNNLAVNSAHTKTPETAFREFRQALSRFLSKRLDNPDDVQDLLQEVFVRVVRNESALREAKIPLAWLYSVTRSVLVDHYRKKGRMSLQLSDVTQALGVPDNLENSNSEIEKCLLPLVKNLPEKYRTVLVCTDLEGQRQVEYAQELGLNISTVKSRIQRGRNMLKQSILSCCKAEHDNNNKITEVTPDCAGSGPCC